MMEASGLAVFLSFSCNSSNAIAISLMLTPSLPLPLLLYPIRKNDSPARPERDLDKILLHLDGIEKDFGVINDVVSQRENELWDRRVGIAREGEGRARTRMDGERGAVRW